MDDKRESRRTLINAKVTITHTHIGDAQFYVRDISDSGVFVIVEGSEFPPLGSIVEVQMQGLPIAAPILEMVVVRRGMDGYGLKFIGTGDPDDIE